VVEGVKAESDVVHFEPAADPVEIMVVSLKSASLAPDIPRYLYSQGSKVVTFAAQNHE
jgi:hypothetical protein